MISSMRSRLVNVGSMIWRFGANHAMSFTMSHCVLDLPWPTDFESLGLDCRQPLSRITPVTDLSPSQLLPVTTGADPTTASKEKSGYRHLLGQRGSQNNRGLTPSILPKRRKNALANSYELVDCCDSGLTSLGLTP
jgi:hypothetical protein